MRRNWHFSYKGSDLLEPANKKVEHHAERLSWWRGELEKAEAVLKKDGLQLRERAVSGGVRHEMVIDHEYQARVRECSDKVDHHEEKHADYERYARAFELNPKSELVLDIDDIAFFGL